MIMKKIKIRQLYIIPIVIFSLLSLLCLSTYIPKKAIEKNVEKSANTLYNQKDQFYKYSLFNKILLENHTDALMINISYSINPNEKLESILINKRNYNEGITQNIIKESIGDLKYDNKKYSMTTELLQTVHKEKINAYEYMKYWHGYIIIVKPLLLLFDITGIRIIIFLIISISLFYLCYLIYKEINLTTSLVVLLSFLSVDLITTSLFNIQGMLVFIIALISSIIVFKKNINNEQFYILLIINGILTAFFDFLTTPIITLLIPIIIRNLKYYKETNTKNLIIYFIKCCIIFFISYFSFWLLKWIIVDILYHRNLIITAFKEIIYRTGNYNNASVFKALFYNFIYAFNPITMIAILLLIKNHKKLTYKENLIFLLCIIATIIWYILTKQHTKQHPFFTYRNYIIITLSMLLIAISQPRSSNNTQSIQKNKKDN